MPIIDKKSVLSGLKVRDAMRRIATHLHKQASINEAAKLLIKFRINSLLIVDANDEVIGVVSKTNIMGAYYAGIPIETPLEAIMMPSPVLCSPEDTLESALDLMRTHKVHRVFVTGDDPKQASGVLAYYDICGLLYRYCHKCERNVARPRASVSDSSMADALRVHEVMTPSVFFNREDESIMTIMEGLEANNVGAVLIMGIKKSGGYPEFTRAAIVDAIMATGKPVDSVFLENCQGGSYEALGEALLKVRQLARAASEAERETVDLGRLCMGVKCGDRKSVV